MDKVSASIYGQSNPAGNYAELLRSEMTKGEDVEACDSEDEYCFDEVVQNYPGLHVVFLTNDSSTIGLFLDKERRVQGFVVDAKTEELESVSTVYTFNSCWPLGGKFSGCPTMAKSTGTFVIETPQKDLAYTAGFIFVMNQPLADLWKDHSMDYARAVASEVQQTRAAELAREQQHQEEVRKQEDREAGRVIQELLYELAADAIRVDGNIYLPDPKFTGQRYGIFLPSQVNNVEAFQTPSGMKTPVVIAPRNRTVSRFYSLEHFRTAKTPILWDGEALTITYNGTTITQKLTVSAKPSYSTQGLEQANDGRVSEAKQDEQREQLLMEQRSGIEEYLSVVAKSFAFAGSNRPGTIDYTVVPRSNSQIGLIVRMSDNNPTNWRACALRMPEGYTLLDATTLNKLPYFRILWRQGIGGQIARIDQSAPFHSNYNSMPECVQSW